MSNPRETALALAVVSTIADAAKTKKDELRYQLLNELNDAGADAVRAEIDGKRIARTTLIAPKEKISVSNESLFVNWVANNYPTEVETIVQVRPAFRQFFLDRLRKVGDQIIDPTTGEVVPYVKETTTNAYVTTRFDAGGRDEVLAALREQRISLDLTTTPQLEAGNS